jgi:hypothetical protein
MGCVLCLWTEGRSTVISKGCGSDTGQKSNKSIEKEASNKQEAFHLAHRKAAIVLFIYLFDLLYLLQQPPPLSSYTTLTNQSPSSFLKKIPFPSPPLMGAVESIDRSRSNGGWPAATETDGVCEWSLASEP